MIKASKEFRQIKDTRFDLHTHIKQIPKFFHRPCKGTTKLKLPCGMPAGLDNYCRIHRVSS